MTISGRSCVLLTREVYDRGRDLAYDDSPWTDEERELLAAEDADGRPFFVMEYVDGQPITEYCHIHRQSVRGRLDLFLPVCDAIRHAHQTPSRWYRARKFLRRHAAAVTIIVLLLLLGGVAGGGMLRLRSVQREMAAAAELSENWQDFSDLSGITARFLQINDWLPAAGAPISGRDRVQLNPQDRDRLRRAMLEDVLAMVERTKPIPLDPQLSIALLRQIAVRECAAETYAEFDRPAQGIPHVQRAIAIANYLGSSASDLSPHAKSAMLQFCRPRNLLASRPAGAGGDCRLSRERIGNHGTMA